MKPLSIGIIGGGPAGFFAACAIAPHHTVNILEKKEKVMGKLLLTGGGRCNLTNATFDLKKLTSFFPRGGKELLGPFHRFGPKETLEWFAKEGVSLKEEENGRVFPSSNKAETIYTCLLHKAKELNITIQTNTNVKKIEKKGKAFVLLFEGGEQLSFDALIVATCNDPHIFSSLQSLGHTVEKPLPSLFTFACSSPLNGLSGCAIPDVEGSICGIKKRGDLLLTHFGFSGPLTLSLSSFAAKKLNEQNYQAELTLKWLPDYSSHAIDEALFALRKREPEKHLSKHSPFPLPKKLWQALFPSDKTYRHLSNKEIRLMGERLQRDRYYIKGKAPCKEEFVTCGGIALNEVNFQTMESKLIKNLFFAGEVLNIDGVTGGFNLQNCWTTGFIAGSSFL